MDPNLLPEDLRGKEEQEQAKLKKQPAGVEIELSVPEPDRVKDELRGGSWFGSVKSPVKPDEGAKLTDPVREGVGVQEIDLLSADGKAKKTVMAPVIKQKKSKSGWLSGLFGRPVSPIIDSSQADNPAIKLAVPQKQVAGYSEAVVSAKEPAEIKEAWPADKLPRREIGVHQPAGQGDSWWEIFKGLFGVGRKKRIDFRLASFANEAMATSENQPSHSAKAQVERVEHKSPVRPVDVKENESAVQPVKKTEPKKARSVADKTKLNDSYHSADKREKASEVNINLMPRELAARFKADGNRTIKQLIIAILLPVILITLGYAAIILLQNDLKAELAVKQQEFNGLESQIVDFIARQKQNNLLADRVAIIKKLLAEKIIWNNFFDKLEKYTLDGVYYSSLTADASGVLILPGVADDYDVLARQLAAFQGADDFLQSAKLINAQLVSDSRAGVVGVGFQLRLALRDNLFKKITQAE